MLKASLINEHYPILLLSETVICLFTVVGSSSACSEWPSNYHIFHCLEIVYILCRKVDISTELSFSTAEV